MLAYLSFLRRPAVRLSMLLAASAGCSAAATSAAPVGPDTAGSALARDTSPSVPPADASALEAGNAAFAFDLYRALHQPGGNLFFSPYSVTSALAMTYAGARSGTADQMAQVLHFTLPAERLHPAFDALDLQLASRAAPVGAGQGQPFTLQVDHALWGAQDASWQQPFLDTLSVDYGADVQLVDFAGDPGGAVGAMNAWVSARTDGRIRQLVPASAVDSSTRFVVADAVLFQASWASPFNAAQTAPAPFAGADGSTRDVPMMHELAHLPYAQTADGWQAVELSYVGGLVAMDVLLPPAGSADASAGLTSERFVSVVEGLELAEVALALPKLDLPGSARSLAGALRDLGMTSALAPGADFGAMCDGSPWLRDVLHQASLVVDENGTQAAAATAGVGPTAVHPPVTVTLDRPFFVAVRDLPTGTILFAGDIAQP